MGAPTPKRWFVVDCVGLLCMSIALAVVGFEWYVINVDVLWPDLQRSPWLSALHMLVFNLLIGMLLASYGRAVTTNPGTVERPPPTYEVTEFTGYQLRFGEAVSLCKKCCAYRPERAHHCSTCGHCVRLLDHHCMWVNNCVGERTQKFFLLFLLYVGLASAHVLLIQGLRIRTCIKDGFDACSLEVSNGLWPVLSLVFSVLFGFLFGVFVLIMGLDQLNALREDASYIERLKKEDRKHEKRSFWSRFCYVFGENMTGFSIDWLLPTEPRFVHASWYSPES